jgi:hypothetical protein
MGILSRLFAKLRGAAPTPLFELWVRDQAVARDPIRMSFLVIRIGRENNWSKERIDQINKRILAGEYIVTPDSRHGGTYHVFVQ